MSYGPVVTFEYLTANEAAERAGRSRRTITRWIRDGRLKPAAQLPGPTGALLFRPADVDALLSPEQTA